MPKKLIHLFLLCMLLAACAPQHNSNSPTAPTLKLADCILPASLSEQVDAQCGTLDVPEDRAHPNGRRIALSVALVPAIKTKPAPDPLFMLAGGPGQSAVSTFPTIIGLLDTIHQDRDIILVDQRGTGKSNPLQCLDPEKDEDLSEQESLQRTQTCPTKLQADARFYTTEIAMQDLDDVRAALGYSKVNLYGASYGTRAALTYLRMFPEHVRTITLDAVVDPSFVLFLDAAKDGQKSLDFFLARCAKDPACHEAFPNLKSELDELLKRLETSPAKVTIPHPITNKPLTITVTRKLLTDLLFNVLYAPDLVALLPLSIHTAYSENNYAPLISQAYMLDAGLYDGMFYAVTCTEDAPLIEPETAKKLSQGSIFGDRTLGFVQTCASWAKGSVSAAFRAPVKSDVPALILSGEADPITPPYHAQKAAAALSNSLHLIFKGMGHGNLSTRCAIKIFSDFLESASLTGLKTDCVAGIAPPPFFVNFSGPRP